MGEERSHIVFESEATKFAKLENSILRTELYRRRTTRNSHKTKEHTDSNESNIPPVQSVSRIPDVVSDEYIPDVMR